MLLKLLLISAAIWTTTLCQNIYFPEAMSTPNRSNTKTHVRKTPPQNSTTGVTVAQPTTYEPSSPPSININRQYIPPKTENSKIGNHPKNDNNGSNNGPNVELIGVKLSDSNVDRWDKIITQGILQMTLEMDNILSPDGVPTPGVENVIFSPTSIAMALSLVMLGSSGKTLTEVSRVLGLEYDGNTVEKRDLIHERFGGLLSWFDEQPGRNVTTRTTMATAVFVQSGYPIKDKYVRVSRNAYRSDIVPLDFLRNNVNAGQIINRWVEYRTYGRIKGFFQEPPSSATKVLLASALYFNGEWEHPFPFETTKRRPFYVSEPGNNTAGETIQVTMMANAVELPYYNDAVLGCQIVSLPYKGRQIVMHVVLPNERGYQGLHTLKEKLTVPNLESLIANTRPTSTIISLPRMKLSSSINLKSTLQIMGLESLFIPGEADLSEISSGIPNSNRDVLTFASRVGGDNATVRRRREEVSVNPGLFADDVLHKVEIEVTETGTVASAVTAVSISRSGSHRTVRMDRPFLFFIRHEVSKLVLFWGAVVRPQ